MCSSLRTLDPTRPQGPVQGWTGAQAVGGGMGGVGRHNEHPEPLMEVTPCAPRRASNCSVCNGIGEDFCGHYFDCVHRPEVFPYRGPLHRVEHVVPCYHAPEHGVFAVQMRVLGVQALTIDMCVLASPRQCDVACKLLVFVCLSRFPITFYQVIK